MKELYISPELEILCFQPMEGIASAQWSDIAPLADNDVGVSTGELPGDFNKPVENPDDGDL